MRFEENKKPPRGLAHRIGEYQGGFATGSTYPKRPITGYASLRPNQCFVIRKNHDALSYVEKNNLTQITWGGFAIYSTYSQRPILEHASSRPKHIRQNTLLCIDIILTILGNVNFFYTKHTSFTF